MAHLTTPPGFSGNKWPENQWARWAYITCGGLRVADSAAWKPTVNTGVARTVDIAIGRGQACGIYDETGTVESFAFAANAGSTDRYDALVSTFNWVTKTVGFAIIQGTTTEPPVNTTGSVISTSVNRIPGIRYDGVLAVVKIRPGVTTLSTSDITDRRIWVDPETGKQTVTSTATPQVHLEKTQNVADNNQAARISGWVPTTALPSDFTINSDGTIRINRTAQLNVAFTAESNDDQQGISAVWVAISGLSYGPENTGPRGYGFPNAGSMRQTGSMPGAYVTAGATVTMWVQQDNQDSGTVSYECDLFLSLT